MAWDDKPPTEEELSASSKSSWDATPPTPEELKGQPKARIASEPKTLAGKVLHQIYSGDGSILPTSSSQTLPERAASALSSIGRNTFLPSMIKPGQASVASLPIASGLESMGDTVKDSALTSFNKIADTPLPNVGNPQGQVALETLRQLAKLRYGAAIQMAPFTPTGFESVGSAELASLAMTPSQGITPKYAKATMEGIIPSSADETRMVDRINTFGKEAKTTAEKVLDRPELGNTRAEIKTNAHKRSGLIQGEIQGAIDSAKDVTASKKDFLPVYDDAINDLKGVPNRGPEIRKIERMKKDFLDDKNIPDEQPLPDWDSARAKLNKDIKSKKGYTKDVTSTQVKIDKGFADTIRDLLAAKIPGIKKLRREQGDLLEIRDSIIQSSPKEVRDPRIWSPFMEQAAVQGSRFLAKKRQAPSGLGAFGLRPNQDALAAQDQP